MTMLNYSRLLIVGKKKPVKQCWQKIFKDFDDGWKDGAYRILLQIAASADLILIVDLK